MATHVMLDLETWGSGPKALPVSIGAVKFDANDILDRFHVGVDVAQLPEGWDKCTIGPQTMLWWLDPERDAARAAWLALDKVDLMYALTGFSQWCVPDFTGDDRPEKPTIWGNGSTFDNVILRNAYAACNMEYPVPFWMDQCYRTIKNRRPDIALERIGTHHSAVDDAESQARHLQVLARELGVTL